MYNLIRQLTVAKAEIRSPPLDLPDLTELLIVKTRSCQIFKNKLDFAFVLTIFNSFHLNYMSR